MEAESDMQFSRCPVRGSRFLFTRSPFACLVRRSVYARVKVQRSNYSASEMDPDFRAILSGAGLGEAALSILVNESVLNMDVFKRLREEHIEKLLPKLTVGDHAIFWQLWETKACEVCITAVHILPT